MYIYAPDIDQGDSKEFMLPKEKDEVFLDEIYDNRGTDYRYFVRTFPRKRNNATVLRKGQHCRSTFGRKIMRNGVAEDTRKLWQITFTGKSLIVSKLEES